MKKDKKYIFICLGFVVILIIGLIFYFYKSENRISYKCSEGYELVDKKCIKEVEMIEPNFELVCDSGFKLVDDSCVKYEYSNDYTVEWHCPSGYKMRKDDYPDICYRTITAFASSKHYYCPSGYTLSGTKCIASTEVTPNKYNVCTLGNYNASTGYCHIAGVFTSCPSGTMVYYRNGNFVTCVSRPFVQYECPKGTKLVGSSCVGDKTIAASYVKGCDSAAGFKINSDGLCTKTEYETPSYKIICKDGYKLIDESCVKTISKIPSEKMSCDNGYDLIRGFCFKFDVVDPIEE